MKTGVWTQSTMQKVSFNFKPEVQELFTNIHSTLEVLNGEEMTKTQVMEWALLVAAKQLADAETRAMKQYRMQNATQ